MRILLTGANGFVGSHILDRLRAGGYAVSVLLRQTSQTGFIKDHLPSVDVRYGSLAEPASLQAALRGAHCVIHCAGKTKVVHTADYYTVNEEGTRNLVCAVNAAKESVKHFVHVSTLAAGHPAGADSPARESDPPQPVSEYGRSKLRAEEVVRDSCEVPYTILRPAAVYGPRDRDFLGVFKAVRRHFMPIIGGGRLQISTVFAGDVAEAVVRCIENPIAHGKTYNVAAPDPCTARDFVREIAAVMNVRTVPIRVPFALLYPIALFQEWLARVTGTPGILSRQKLAEMKASGWVCSTESIKRDIGFTAGTPLREGLACTIRWYEENGWL